jgi:hypothetical protein
MTKAQLDDFHTFATRQLANGGADLSLEDLVWKWRDRAEMCEEIRTGLENRKAGLGIPLEQAINELRRELRSRETV